MYKFIIEKLLFPLVIGLVLALVNHWLNKRK